MMIIAGTVPIEDFPLIYGEVIAEGEDLIIDGHRVPRTQGTGIMLASALATTSYLKLDPPHAVLAGDVGKGDGSRAIYEYLIEHIAGLSPEVLAFTTGSPIWRLPGGCVKALITAAVDLSLSLMQRQCILQKPQDWRESSTYSRLMQPRSLFWRICMQPIPLIFQGTSSIPI